MVRDGVEALHFVGQRAPFEQAPRPHMTLLDLNLPKKDGRQVLSAIKSEPDLRRIWAESGPEGGAIFRFTLRKDEWLGFALLWNGRRRTLVLGSFK